MGHYVLTYVQKHKCLFIQRSQYLSVSQVHEYVFKIGQEGQSYFGSIMVCVSKVGVWGVLAFLIKTLQRKLLCFSHLLTDTCPHVERNRKCRGVVCAV